MYELKSTLMITKFKDLLMFEQDYIENNPSIEGIAFIAAKRGEFKLMELLLGPSVEKEKKEYITLNAIILRYENHKRMYDFMSSLTEHRLKCISDYMKAPEQYRNIQTLNSDLSGATAKVIQDIIDSISAQIDINGVPYCVELTNHPLINMKLDIDKYHEPVNEADETIITFLTRVGIRIPDNEQIIHFQMTQRIAEEMIHLWNKRLHCRASKMPLPELQHPSEVIDLEEQLKEAFNLYDRKMEEYNTIKIPLSTKAVELAIAYEQRITPQ